MASYSKYVVDSMRGLTSSSAPPKDFARHPAARAKLRLERKISVGGCAAFPAPGRINAKSNLLSSTAHILSTQRPTMGACQDSIFGKLQGVTLDSKQRVRHLPIFKPPYLEPARSQPNLGRTTKDKRCDIPFAPKAKVIRTFSVHPSLTSNRRKTSKK